MEKGRGGEARRAGGHADGEAGTGHIVGSALARLDPIFTKSGVAIEARPSMVTLRNSTAEMLAPSIETIPIAALRAEVMRTSSIVKPCMSTSVALPN